MRTVANSSLEFDPAGPEYRAGVTLALKLITASMTGIELEPTPTLTHPARTRFVTYEPILWDLMTDADLADNVGQRIAAFVFGIGELARIAAIAWEDPKASDMTRDEMAGVIVTAFRNVYLPTQE